MMATKASAATSSASPGLTRLPSSLGSLNMDEVWRDDVSEMTLEDYLARADAGEDDEVHGPVGFNAVDESNCSSPLENQILKFGDESFGVTSMGIGFGGCGRGRGRKRPQNTDLVDRAAIQRQKRMIKNRESAARSRERKQAYTAELESLVTRLEEERAMLLKYQDEQRHSRLKELTENVIPITDKRKPRRSLRRTNSMQW